MRLNDYYHDRGIQKYTGFFLSEHTSSLKKEQMKSNKIIKSKEQMTEEQIFEMIDFSIYKNTEIAVQLNIKDIDGNFCEDIAGSVQGYDEENIYLDDIKVSLILIRNVKTFPNQKWFN